MTHLDDILASLPSGFDRALLSILRFHRGRDNAIPRTALLDKLKMIGWTAPDRSVRAQINLLRKDGHLICSCGGHGGGYYIARDWSELEDYIGQELRPRAMDLLEQEKALKVGAKREWGINSSQLGLLHRCRTSFSSGSIYRIMGCRGEKLPVTIHGYFRKLQIEHPACGVFWFCPGPDVSLVLYIC